MAQLSSGRRHDVIHLANHDVMLWAICRAPLAKLQTYKQRMGWTFFWASSAGGDLNSDFSASFTEQEQREGIGYNYEREEPVAAISSRSTSDAASKFPAMCGTDVNTWVCERPGISAFALENGAVYHTYSALRADC
jgi:predicted dithiol-disulfide oxidoreductase (DUF899 family)